jgi:branched-chain amino acid transport system ATP-binding protein
MLELVGVSLCYGVARALRGVSLRVPEGSVVALPGANGAGKTSALRAISGVAKISEGRIELDSR